MTSQKRDNAALLSILSPQKKEKEEAKPIRGGEETKKVSMGELKLASDCMFREGGNVDAQENARPCVGGGGG